MTVRCGGGTSSEKTGQAAQILVGMGLITEGTLALAPWLLPFTIYADIVTLQASTSCATDPPPMPTSDQLNPVNAVGGIFNPNFDTWRTAFHNLILNYLWDKFCQCDTTTFVPRAPLPPPAGTGGSGGTTGQPCFVGTLNAPAPNLATGTSYGDFANLTIPFLPTDGTTFIAHDPNNKPFTVYGIPQGVTSVTWTTQGATSATCPTPPGQGWPLIELFDSTGLHLGASFALFDTANKPAVHTGTSAIPANARYWFVWAGDPTPAAQCPVSTNTLCSLKVWCGTGPGVIQSCCPGDPSIQIGIQNILDIVSNIAKNTTSAALTWHDGVRHSALSGNGSFVLSGKAIGIRAEVTTQPAPPNIIPGTPNFFWDMGFITPIVLSSPLRGFRLVFLSESFPLPAFTDSIGFTLRHGTVMDVVELLPTFT